MKPLYVFVVCALAFTLTSCERAGRMTDFLPSAVFLHHDPESAFPDINSVPDQPDPRLNSLAVPGQIDHSWTDTVLENQSELLQRESPKKRIFNDPDWPIDDEL